MSPITFHNPLHVKPPYISLNSWLVHLHPACRVGRLREGLRVTLNLRCAEGGGGSGGGRRGGGQSERLIGLSFDKPPGRLLALSRPGSSSRPTRGTCLECPLRDPGWQEDGVPAGPPRQGTGPRAPPPPTPPRAEALNIPQ